MCCSFIKLNSILYLILQPFCIIKGDILSTCGMLLNHIHLERYYIKLALFNGDCLRSKTTLIVISDINITSSKQTDFIGYIRENSPINTPIIQISSTIANNMIHTSALQYSINDEFLSKVSIL